MEMTSDMTSDVIKNGHLTKAFQNEKHDTASQWLKKYVNRNWCHCWL